MFAFYKEFGELDVLSIETQALFFGLQECLQREIFPLLVEVDSQVLVCVLQTSKKVRWSLCITIERILSLLGQLSAKFSMFIEKLILMRFFWPLCKVFRASF